MTTTYQVPNFRPEDVHRRFVRYVEKNTYKVILVRSNGATIQEATAEGHEIAEDVRHAADLRKGMAFGYAEWPL